MAAAALALTAAVATPAGPEAAAAEPVRVMPLGDSITEGDDGDATYRFFLWETLQAAGRAVDLVGTRSGVLTGSPQHTDFDQDHEGHSGWRADELVTGRADRPDEGTLSAWVAAAVPDVVLVHIGTNDIRQCAAPEVVAARIAAVVDTIRAARPAATLLLAQIIPTTVEAERPCAPEAAARVADLNQRIAALAAAATTVSSPVLAVDQHTGFDLSLATDDGVHPNEVGERHLAGRWYAALDAVLPPEATTTTTESTTTTTVPTTETTEAPTTTVPPTTTTTSTTTTTTTTSVPTTTTTAPPPPPPARAGYWMLGAKGEVYAFGDAVDLGNAAVGARTAMDIEATPDGDGYWIVDDGGKVHRFGSAQDFGHVVAMPPGEVVTSLAGTATGRGYWLFTSIGRALAFGDAARGLGDMVGTVLNGPVLDGMRTAAGRGYYMVGSDGGVFSFGDAGFHGSMGGIPLNGPVLSLAPDPDRSGYWLVAADGGVFSFAAPFRGSMGGVHLNRPVVGMVPYGNGYLMVAADGGIFNFSDRPFLGSLGDDPPAIPVVSVAALADPS